jgi:hypothetical protein
MKKTKVTIDYRLEETTVVYFDGEFTHQGFIKSIDPWEINHFVTKAHNASKQMAEQDVDG